MGCRTHDELNYSLYLTMPPQDRQPNTFTLLRNLGGGGLRTMGGGRHANPLMRREGRRWVVPRIFVFYLPSHTMYVRHARLFQVQEHLSFSHSPLSGFLLQDRLTLITISISLTDVKGVHNTCCHLLITIHEFLQNPFSTRRLWNRSG